MSKNYRNLLTLFLIISIGFFSTFPASAKKSEKLIESLNLRDFKLLPETKGDKKELIEYVNYLEGEYKNHSDVFSAAIPYGLSLIDKGDTEKAFKIFEKAEKDFIGNPSPKVYKAWALACNEDYIAAKNIWLPIAYEKYNAGITGYNSGIWLPYHIDAIFGLLLIKDYLPKEDKAEVNKVVSEIIVHFQKQPKFLAVTTLEDLNNGRLKEAEEKMLNGLSSEPNNPILLTLQGWLSYINGDYEDTIELLNKANDINPTSPTNNLMRVKTFVALGDKEEAISALRDLEESDPTLVLTEADRKKMLISVKKNIFSGVASKFLKDKQKN